MYSHRIERLKPFLENDSDGIWNVKDGFIMMYDDRLVINIDTNDAYIMVPAERDDIECVELNIKNVKDIRVYQEVKLNP